jgi:hypothetical protein
MNDITKPKVRGIDFNEVRGSFLAWLWKGRLMDDQEAR